MGGFKIGGSIEPVYNAVDLAELAVEKGAPPVYVPDIPGCISEGDTRKEALANLSLS